MPHYKFLATLLLVSTSAFASVDPPSLCVAPEATYFTCSTGTKVISLCASAGLSATSGTLQYRFGKNTGEIEMSYPSPPSNPRAKFQAYLYSFAKGGVSAIGFKVGRYSYSLFETHSVYGYNGAGVMLRKDGKPLKTIECKTLPSTPSQFYYELSKLHIPEAGLDYIGPEQ